MNLVTKGPAPRAMLLEIYLNDHHAGSVGGVELARRCRSSNPEPPLAPDLDRLITEVVQDRQTLEQVMRLLGVRRNPLKQAAAFAAEKAGRAKLNGQLTGYSDLSRLVELEGLALGVTGKRALWESLAQLADRRLAAIDFDELLARADRQLKVLAQHRLAAAALAFP
jgi:hypothetical protein